MLSTSVLLPYLMFCAVMSATPGPNNAIALASGVKVGFLRSLPIVFGIAFGVAVLVGVVGLGLGAVFEAFPILHDVLRVLGTAYLLWLAYKIATSGPITSSPDERPPLGFLGGALFQWVNPKAWALATGAIAAYVPADGYFTNVLLASVLIGVVCVPSVSIWVAGGTALRKVLGNPTYARVFNIAMGILLVVSTVPIILG